MKCIEADVFSLVIRKTTIMIYMGRKEPGVGGGT
jgi:hypothetical protein